MAQRIEQLIAGGDFHIGAIQDAKSRIAPVTRDGKPVLITLSATPELTTPFSPWPSFDGGERCSLDLRITPELETLSEWIDECVQRQVAASPATWYSKVPKNLTDLYNSCRRTASKEGLSDTFRAKASLREKSASFKAWDLEKQVQLTVDQLKNEVDWPGSAMAVVVQLSGVYFQAATGYGPVLNAKQVGLRTASAECPFEFLQV
jgi:hypothetical protein